jgi:hypothetical protein
MPPSTVSLLQKAPHRYKLLAAQFLLCIGLRKCPLRSFFIGTRNLYREIQWHQAGLYGGNEPFFSLLKQARDHVHVFKCQTDLGGNLSVVIAALSKRTDFLNQVDCSMLAPGAVFNQTHNKALAFVRLDHDRRNDRLLKFHERLEPALAAN